MKRFSKLSMWLLLLPVSACISCGVSAGDVLSATKSSDIPTIKGAVQSTADKNVEKRAHLNKKENKTVNLNRKISASEINRNKIRYYK